MFPTPTANTPSASVVNSVMGAPTTCATAMERVASDSQGEPSPQSVVALARHRAPLWKILLQEYQAEAGASSSGIPTVTCLSNLLGHFSRMTGGARRGPTRIL